MDFSLFWHLHFKPFRILAESQLGIFMPAFWTLYKNFKFFLSLVTELDPNLQKSLFCVFHKIEVELSSGPHWNSCIPPHYEHNP
jgi:hypothetical protein